ncbi:hypothetical protein I314_05398 [Cryptococcus bacillisporus CA1873]|uniref:Uncharacterized protein n=1 Tax=Cryptococcus bacillisporus CA1873 TaxID=1296111 RepID=A0ABR5B4P4_CRYGA|nr:hypothetical protein I314_05398 [Cryptococcus bacillisporus CA1873]|eukprot:KIR58559.1 hypothetical protein I314_05398 [Cryptococcus gattii CA1873]
MSAFWESECVDGNYNDPARTKERVLEVCFFLMEPVRLDIQPRLVFDCSSAFMSVNSKLLKQTLCSPASR